MNHQKEIQHFLKLCILQNSTPVQVSWIENRILELLTDYSERKLFFSFSQVSRNYNSKVLLTLSEEQKLQAKILRNSWFPENWTIPEAVRALILLSVSTNEPENYKNTLLKILECSDVSELEAIYKFLAIIPSPEKFVDMARDGSRYNMKSVFESLAIQNPFSGDYFPEDAWNQLILKSFFIESDVNQILQLDQRCNLTLAIMLCDYAHERWAAGRKVSPSIWRCVAPFVSHPEIRKDIELALSKIEDRKEIILSVLSNTKIDSQEWVLMFPFFAEYISGKSISYTNN